MTTYHSPSSVFTTKKTLTYHENTEPEGFFCFVIDGKLHATVLHMTQARVRNVTNVTTCRGSETAKIRETVFTPPPQHTFYHYTCTI